MNYPLHQNLSPSPDFSIGCSLYVCLPDSTQERGVGNSFPGLQSPLGSKAHRIRYMVSKSWSPNMRGMNRFLSYPTPCSPVMLPPASTQTLRISPDSSSAFSNSPFLEASYRMSGCMFPSPAWKTFASRCPYIALIFWSPPRTL